MTLTFESPLIILITISTFCLAFPSFVAGNPRDFKFGMSVEHSNLATDDKSLKPSMKWAWSRHVIQFKFQGPNHILGITGARIVKFLTKVGYIKYYQKDDIKTPI